MRVAKPYKTSLAYSVIVRISALSYKVLSLKYHQQVMCNIVILLLVQYIDTIIT